MSLIKLSIKNIFQNPKRTFTLGFFIFLVSFVMVIVNSLIYTVNNNMQDALINSFSGTILVRGDVKADTELFSMDARWSKSDFLEKEQFDKAEAIINQNGNYAEFTPRVRLNVLLSTKEERRPSMVVGIDPSLKAYKNSVVLESGEYLDAKRDDQVIIMEEQAKKLKINVGDVIEVQSLASDGKMVAKSMSIVGIGNMKMLSKFNFPAAFMNYKTAQELAEYDNGQVSDIAIYLKEKSEASKEASKLSDAMRAANLNTQVSSFDKLGGYIMSSVSIYMTMFNGFILVIMVIVAILIVNLIFMMGLERRQEIGTLKAIGFSRPQNIFIFIGEILSIGVLFCLSGVTIAGVLVKIFTNIRLKTQPPLDYLLGKEFLIQFDFSQLLIVVAMVIGLVFVSSFYPCYRIASLKPVDTLKEI